MKTIFKNRFYVVADDAGAEWFRKYARDVLNDDGWETVCRSPLTGKDNAKAKPTHWCASFVATDEQSSELDALQVSGKLPAGVQLSRVDARRGVDQGKLLFASDIKNAAKLGQKVTATIVFDDLGLTKKEPTVEAVPDKEIKPK